MQIGPILALCAISLVSAVAQETEGSSSDDASSESTSSTGQNGYVRTWVMVPAGAPAKVKGVMPDLKDTLRLAYTDANGADASLVSNPYPYMTTGYNELSPGSHTLQLLRKVGEKDQLLTRAEIRIKPGSFLTMIISLNDGRYRLDVADDTPPPPKNGEKDSPPKKEIVFYNFVPSTSFEVKCDNPSFTESANFGHPKKVGNLPGKLLNLSAVIPNGKRKLTSTVEADLLINDSLSYVIVQDMYGRIIPAIMPNAKLD